MAVADERVTTVVSTKGQVILPKAIRATRDWAPGTRLVIEETAEGVLLRPAPLFATTDPAEVFASVKTSGPPRTIEQMDAAVAAEVRRRHARK
jgi:AbrB family looped-hinge helix DNA binding protein